MKAVNRISEENSRVKLNIYDLHDSNESLIPFGLGLFHSGVVVGGSEYTFASGGGIFNHEPKGAAAKFRETVNIGSFHGSSQQLAQIIEELRQDFTGSNYHVLTRNCNHFADEFLQRLVNKSIPGYINRLANLGSVFSCLLPESVTNNAPVDNNPSAGSLGSRTSNTRGKANIETSYRPFAGTPMVLGMIHVDKDILKLKKKPFLLLIFSLYWFRQCNKI